MHRTIRMIALGFAAALFAVGITSATSINGADCCKAKAACACACQGNPAACACPACSSCGTCGAACCR